MLEKTKKKDPRCYIVVASQRITPASRWKNGKICQEEIRQVDKGDLSERKIKSEKGRKRRGNRKDRVVLSERDIMPRVGLILCCLFIVPSIRSQDTHLGGS